MSNLLSQALEHHRAGRLREAEALYREVLRGQSDHPDALHLLGVLAFQCGRQFEALATLVKAIRINPSVAPFHNNLGIVLNRLGRREEALGAFRKALELDPDFAEARNNLGDALHRQGRLEEAMACYREALRLNPDYADAHNNLGNALMETDRPEEALAHLQRALRLRPRWAEGYNNLGNAFLKLAFLDEAVASYRAALGIDPDCPGAHSALLFCLNADPGSEPEAVFAEHRRWAERHAAPLEAAEGLRPNDPHPERRLRLGYVSPDFRTHSVACFFEPVLASHNREAFEVYCYSKVIRADAVTARIGKLADGWRDIRSLNDEEAAGLVRFDQIDILVDLAGHTSGHALPLFALKPAPVQVTWLGYPNTTGLDAIDYRLTDAWADPPGQTEQLHSEQLVRLPGCFLSYQPPEDAPAVTALPALETGGVTFGSFNNLLKVTSQVLAAWAEILRRLPGSRLLLKSRRLEHPAARQRILEKFGAAGIDEERIKLLGYLEGRGQHLELYNHIDVALDTFPYHGTTTTCEALWMGVPVVVLAGRTHASRVGVSLLNRAGLGDWIADSAEGYVELAVRRASDREGLAKLRQTLRDRLRRSPLLDTGAFTTSLEEAYRQMWRRWCAVRGGVILRD